MTDSGGKKFVLLSIQPTYAEMIFSGSKTVELRRNFPTVEKNQWVIIYASSPVKAILGAFQIDFVLQEEKHRLWQNVEGRAGVTRTEFDCYYEGVNEGYGIFINQIYRYSNLITLSKLRSLLLNFSPPQSYRYMDYDQAYQLDLLGFESKQNNESNKSSYLSVNNFKYAEV